jgi:putative transposase
MLSDAEQEYALAVLHEPRFVDLSPLEIYAILLDEGKYIASPRTLYRLLAANGEVGDRRDQLRHERYAVPRLCANAPNQVWSWDITKLKGPVPGALYFLYVVIDIFSRYVVGWMVAERESAKLAVVLFEEACTSQRVDAASVIVHADRGGPMKSRPLGEKLAELGHLRSFSRPRVSNDNPFSESNFKTLKYRPDFPDHFGSHQHARAHLGTFFGWYNNDHRHSGIALLTPHDVHYGREAEVLAARQRVLDEAFAAHPHRFSGRRPLASRLALEVWINKPNPAVLVQTIESIEDA